MRLFSTVACRMSHVACRMSLVLRKMSCSLMNSCLFDFLALSLFSHVDMLKKPNDEVICSARLRRFNRNTGSYWCGSKIVWDMDFFQGSCKCSARRRRATIHPPSALCTCLRGAPDTPSRCYLHALPTSCVCGLQGRAQSAHSPACSEFRAASCQAVGSAHSAL